MHLKIKIEKRNKKTKQKQYVIRYYKTILTNVDLTQPFDLESVVVTIVDNCHFESVGIIRF